MIGNEKTVLITGASSGIGEELAACFAQGGFDLLLVARSVDKLRAVATRLSSEYGIKARAIPSDLSQPGSAEKLFKKVTQGKHTVDILVNCAGVLEHGAFIKMPAHRHQELIDLNVSALTAMLAHFVPPMVERGFGRILNVASIAAFQPIPSLATYAATKAFVLSLTESLSEELKGTGVSACALCPGITATHMMAAAQQGSPSLKVPAFLVGDARQVAADGYQACLNGDVIKVPGVINLAGTWAARVTPKWVLRGLGGAVGRATWQA